MNNKDFIQKFIFENAPVRGEVVRLDHSYQAIIQQHNYPPDIKKLLGEAFAIVNLLAAIIKFKGRLTLQFQGKKGLKLLLAQCNQDFHFRGLAQWIEELNSEELIEALQEGTLAIMIDQDKSVNNRYQGIVNWQGRSLAQSIEGYFKNSEQLPTRLWIEVSETQAVGLLLQILPSEASNSSDWEHIICLTETLKPSELLECNNEMLLHRLYHEEKVRVFEPMPVEFRCTCSVAKSENALLLLGEKEVEEELHNKQQIVVTCEFCNKSYMFDRVDVANIFKKGEGHSSSKVH